MKLVGFADHEEPMFRQRQSAFSLIELLVVITITAVLLALGLGAVNRTRASAKTTVCIANLQQIGVSLSMYAEEYRGWFYPPRNTPVGWFHLVPGLERSFASTLWCPTESEPVEFPPGSGERYTYVLNGHLQLLSLRRHSRSPDRRNSADWILMGEKRSGTIDRFMDPGDFERVVDTLRHQGGANYLFADFHVEWKRPWQTAPGCLDPWDVAVVPPSTEQARGSVLLGH